MLQLSAKKGFPLAQYNLAVTLVNGNEADKKQAFNFFKSVAEEHKILSAIGNLATMFEQGIGTEKSMVEARKWYQVAAEAEHPHSMFNLALIRMEEDLTDKEKAFEWFEEAAKKGHPGSMFNWATILVKKDEKHLGEAAELFIKAAEAGHDKSAYLVADSYEKGIYVDVDLEKAAQFYKTASDRNHIQATRCLAEMYKNGRGVEENLREANALFNKAIKLERSEKKTD